MGSDDWLYDNDVLKDVFEGKEHPKGIVSGKTFFRGKESGEAPEPWMFFVGYGHQSAFFHKNIFGKYSYTDRYKIFGDQLLFMQVYSDNEFEWTFTNRLIAHYSTGGFSDSMIDVRFANDAEKNMRKYFPELSGRARYQPLRKRAYDAIKKGNWLKGLKWAFLGGMNYRVLRNVLYCFKLRILGKA